MKFENIRVYNFECALRGMRNPKNSCGRSDSEFGIKKLDANCGQAVAESWAREVDPKAIEDFVSNEDLVTDYSYWLWRNGILQVDKDDRYAEVAFIGPQDLKLAMILTKAGPEHRKFLRQIFVSVDITAPLYWWKEFDTYKVGTVANSTSTMHKLAETPITFECFEIGDYQGSYAIPEKEEEKLPYPDQFIEYLEYLRQKYLETQEIGYWKELIRWLPESWLQTRTVTMNYENLLAMCSKGQRRYHKLTEWSDSFIKFARKLPYAQQLIFLDEIV